MNRTRPVSGHSAQHLIERLAAARQRLRAMIGCLPADGWLGPRADHLNPPLWEYGHVVWFRERWCLRARPGGSFADTILPGADALYDSSRVPHRTRWGLPLLPPAEIDSYAAQVDERVNARLRDALDDELGYFAELCLYHELMHIEAWWMAFQNLGFTPPYIPASHPAGPGGRLAFAAGEVALGSRTDTGFIFDNEKWQHSVPVAAFDMDANPISETAYAEFVEDGGYQRQEVWSAAGWEWRVQANALHPLYWQRTNGAWRVRRFDAWHALDPDTSMLHVNRYEAEACAAWMKRALPSAAQWVRAVGCSDFSWGSVWEWTRDPFVPYPGFAPDPYADYSQPWFHTHTELRGGGPVTDASLKRSGFRNFYLPYRRDPFAGFRTVSAD